MTESIQTKRAEALAGKALAVAERAGLELVLGEETIVLAVKGTLNSRTGRLLAKPPVFRERPLASLLGRLIEWHLGSGNLWGIQGVHFDIGLLLDFDPATKQYGEYWTGPKSNMANDHALAVGVTEKELFETLTTISIILCGGSPATQRWEKALS